MNNNLRTLKSKTIKNAVEDVIAAKVGYIAGAVTVIGVTAIIIAWEHSKYTGSNFSDIAIAAILSGLASVVCFFVSVAEITCCIEQVFFCAEKFQPEDARAIRQFAVARLIIALISVSIVMGKGIPWLHSMLLNPSDLAFLRGIGIL